MSRTMPLEVIWVEEPCPADWDAMTGDAAKRFCAGCQKHVYNLSAMPREAAEELVCESAGTMCVRFQTAADGHVLTLDYGPKARIRGGWKLWTLVGLIGAAFAGVAHALTGTKPVAPPPPPVMGAMVIRPVLPPQPNGKAVMGEIACPNTPPPAPASDPLAPAAQ